MTDWNKEQDNEPDDYTMLKIIWGVLLAFVAGLVWYGTS